MHAWTRGGIAASALALVAALPAPLAHAATDTAPAARGAAWLAPQVESGMVVSEYYDGSEWQQYDDQGLTLDVLLALVRTGVAGDTRTAILDRLSQQAEIEEYTVPFGTFTPGAVGKLVSGLRTAGRSPAAAGDGTLVSDLESSVGPSGRANANGGEDYGNSINQSWVVRGLAMVDSDKTTSATRYLQAQQCSAGYVRESISDGLSCATAAPEDRGASVEATAFAVRALLAARSAGVTGLDRPLARAKAWLLDVQRPVGAFASNGVRNSDATGLGADALFLLGARGRAANAAGWLLAQQVRRSTIAAFPALAGENGAVAYDAKGLDAAESDGIERGARYQWRKATADAVLGLTGLAPTRALGVRAPDRASKGRLVEVRISGLLAGERYVVRLGGRQVRSGFYPGAAVVRTVRMPDRAGKVTLSVTGSRPGRSGSETIAVR